MSNRRNFLKKMGVGAASLVFAGTATTITKASALTAKPFPVVDPLKSLYFNANKKYKIVQFSDLHYVPENEKLSADTKHVKLVKASKAALDNISTVLDIEKPDLVILTGDIVWGEPAERALKDVLKPIVDRNQKFAVMWGNHDAERDLTNAQLQKIVENTPGNVGIDDKDLIGNSDFTLPILDKKQKPTFLLYGIDSHAYSNLPQVEGYDWIKNEQVEAYKKQSKAYTQLNGGIPIPALAFFHIPLPEYNLAASDESLPLLGMRAEKACAPQINSGMFTAMLQGGDVMGTFVGHDHDNNYVMEYFGITLGYGQFSGGKTVYFNLPCGNGARVFELTSGERGFKTWIRLHSGEKMFEYKKMMTVLKDKK